MKQRIKLLAASLASMGLPGIGEVHVLTGSSSSAPYSYWTDLVDPDRHHTSLATAESRMTSGRNDTLLVSPESHTISAAFTWDLSNSAMIGMSPEGMMNQRSRIGHTVAMSPAITVSGQGNLFRNLYVQTGGGGAASLIGLKVSGDRNSFINCHILNTNATACDQATYNLVHVACGEGYFKNCFFGGDSTVWTNGDMIYLEGDTSLTCRAYFENCMFVMSADNNQVNFIKTTPGLGSGTMYFRNCQFVNRGTTITLAIDGAGLGNAKLFFDKNCVFYGATDVVAAAYESYVISGFDYAADDDAKNLLAGVYDHTS